VSAIRIDHNISFFPASRNAAGFWLALRRIQLSRQLWGLIRRFKTPISGKLVGHSIVGLNPMAAKGFNRQSARAPSDHGPNRLRRKFIISRLISTPRLRKKP
jgi:hypothetical protein